MRSHRGQCGGSESSSGAALFLVTSATDADSSPFDLAASFAALCGGLSQERGEERSDPESASPLVSAICVGSNEQFRIVYMIDLWSHSAG